jgi:hypothetical protein
MKACYWYYGNREVVPDLAPMLWHSFGTMAALLQVRTHIIETLF